MRRPSGRMRATLACALAAFAAGCATPPSVPSISRPPPAVLPKPSPADQLVAVLVRLKAMDEVALADEVARTRKAADAAPGDLAHLEAALALSVWPVADDAEILARTAPLLRESPPAAAEMRAMAGFLQGMVLERRKLRESATAAAAKSRDDRREALAQKQRADAQQERADRLQQKLEALTNLEKSLSNRKHADDPARRPR